MKKVLRVAGLVLLLMVVLAGAVVGYVSLALPNVGAAPALKLDATQARVERGRYLANTVCVCINCHSDRDWSKFAGPVIDTKYGMGGEVFDRKVGMPGVYYAKNITPTGVGRYTDGELYRVITTGVTKEGKALFPLMPYTHYGKMDPEDVYSIIAYIRSLQPIENKVPESESDFPMNVIINTIPKKAEPVKRPAAGDTKAYGEYLVNAASCIECHTKENHGQIIQELAFGGGRAFPFPDGSVVRASNITPDQKTGIGAWDKEMFINRFKAYADSNYHPPTVSEGAFNTIMPWTEYARMTREDLAAIYAYLKTLKPIENSVVKFSAAKL